MKLAGLIPAALAAITLALPASAATIGTLDDTRVLAKRVLDTGTDRDTLRATLAGGGHTVAASESTLTSTFLSTLDVFYTSTLTFGAGGVLSSDEQGALVDFVSGGGILLATTEGNSVFAAQTASVLSPFGISTVSQGPEFGTVFSLDAANPLLGNGVAGMAAGGQGTGILSSDPFTALAESGGNLIGLSKTFGAGLVVAIGDSNFLDDGNTTAASQQFVLNVLDAELVAPVPLPAGLPLLLAGLGGLALLRRKG